MRVIGRKSRGALLPVDSAYGIPTILNSDQGCQFTSAEYKALLKDLQIRQGIDGKSRWADNIMIERWFRSLKTEQIYPNEYHSPKELRKLIGDYVHAYNTERPHEALEYAVPNAVYYGMLNSPSPVNFVHVKRIASACYEARLKFQNVVLTGGAL